MRPSDFELFAMYHLALLPDGTGAFQNVNQIARRCGVGVDELKGWLRAAQIDAETAEGIDYDLPAQHGEVQVLATLGDAAGALAFARHVYEEYRARLGTKKVRRFDDE